MGNKLSPTSRILLEELIASYIEKEGQEGRVMTRDDVLSNYSILDPMCLEAALSDLVRDIEGPVDVNDELALDEEQLGVFQMVSKWTPANPNKHFVLDETWEARQKRVMQDRRGNSNSKITSRNSSSHPVAATKRSRGSRGEQQTPVSNRSATSTPRSLASSSSRSSFPSCFR